MHGSHTIEVVLQDFSNGAAGFPQSRRSSVPLPLPRTNLTRALYHAGRRDEQINMYCIAHVHKFLVVH